MLRNVFSINKTAYPVAGANVLSAAIDLGPGGGNGLQNGRFAFEHPALPALVDAKTLTTELYHCATSGGTYTAVEGYGNMIQTGAGGVGVPAKTYRMPIADHVLQFVKLKLTVLAAGGDSTALFATFAVEVP